MVVDVVRGTEDVVRAVRDIGGAGAMLAGDDLTRDQSALQWLWKSADEFEASARQKYQDQTTPDDNSRGGLSCPLP